MSDSIKVAIKVRPLIKRELDENLPIQWAVQGNSIAPVDPELRKRGEGGFYFDHIFDSSQTNGDLFNIVAKPIIDAVLNGVNGTIFAYGQTSSGKTYTMMGSRDNPGVIPLAVDYIFDTMTNTYGREFLLRISYIEIYNERINDLLDKSRIDLKIKEDTKTREITVDCKEEICNTPERVLAIMKKGDGNRRTGETNMNERSSRSHTIFRITLESQATNDDSEGAAVHISQLNLVDLAGSEKAGQTGATGERFNEGRHINLSLSSLGLVIMQLSDAQDNPQKFVNFRDSKLTRILQASLGGNAMTTIICAITPAAVEQTQCTLAFASRAKRVKNKPQVNEELSDKALIKRYAKQMAKLKADLEKMKSADVMEMESKLMEKERANQLLEERIELLKKSIVCGSRSSEEETFNRNAKRRRTWGGSGTSNSKTPPLHKFIGLPTIKEFDKTPEKNKKQEDMKRRQSIFQSIDIANQTFQTEFADFELELIESERARIDNNRLSDASSVCDEDLFICRRPKHNVQFKDDVSVISSGFRNNMESSPERKTPESSVVESASPGTPKPVLRSRAAFLMEEYNVLRNDHRILEEFAKLEKQMIVDDAVEKAMAVHNKELAASEQRCREITEKYTKLESHSSASDKRLAELEQQLAESANSLKALKLENQCLMDELNKSKISKPRSDSQTSYNEKETSSIFANNTYFEDMDVSDAQCDSPLLNDTQDNSIGNITVNKLDESKKSKELSNAAYSEFIKQIGEKSSDELATVMQELINTKLSLEDDNANLQSMLQRKIREADDVKNDIRELKSGIEKLQETIHLLTVENTDLTCKLSTEKEHAKEAEKSLQSTITELNLSINAVTEEKTLLEVRVKELDQQLPACRKIVPSNDEEMRKIIISYEEKIASLTAENEELSSNLMSKIEELDHLKDSKNPPGDHECAYRELSINLSDRNKLLEAENIELSNNLMEKIEEYDIVKEELEKFKISSSVRLIEIPENSNIESTDKNDGKSTNRTVDDLLRLSIGADNSYRQSIEKSHKNGLDLRPENTNGFEESVPRTSTVDDLLQISVVANGTFCGINESDKENDQNVDAWKLKAEMLQEQVNNLNLLNNKLSDLKITSCTQCAHLTELNENRKSLKLEAKALNKKLQELQEKFDRECADSALLRTKANEDLNLSICDLTFNGSFMPEGNLNISFVEEKVQALHHELEELREKHDKLSDLYKEKCDEIDKIQEACSRETTPTPISNDSPRIKRSDGKLDRIKTDMDKLRTDFQCFKKNIAGISAALQKFVNEKAIMLQEIESLRAEKGVLTEVQNSIKTDEKIVFLENEVARLNEVIANSNLVVQELENEKSFLVAEVESLKEERVAFEEKIAAEDSASGQERIESLENEVTRLCQEIQSSSALKRQWEDAKVFLETEVQSLQAEKAAFDDKISRAEDKTAEKIKSLENEVARLSREISESNADKDKLTTAKSSLEAEVEALKAEKVSIVENITKTESSTEEKIKSLENEVARLSEEIRISNAIKEELENVKSSLEAEVEFLKVEKSTEKEFTDAKDSSLGEKVEFLESEVARLHNSNLLHRVMENAKSLQKDEEEFSEDSTGTENISMTQETIKYLENEVSQLSEKINNSNVVKEVLVSTKSSLEAEVKCLKAEEVAYDEKITQTEGTSAQERINLLENEVARLNDEIIHSNDVKEELESAKSSLEAEVQYLKSQKASKEAETASTAQERISILETEIIRLGEEIEGSNALNQQVESAKCSLEAEIDALKVENKIREESINELLQSLKNLESINTTLKITLEKVTSEKNELVNKIAESQIGPNNNDEDLSKIVEELQLKLKETSEDLKNCMLINEELNNRLTTIKASENELNAAKLQLEDEITALQTERINYERSLATLRETLEKLQENNASITSAKEITILELEKFKESLKEKEEENMGLKDRLKVSEKTEEELKDKLRVLEKSEEELTNAKLDITNLKSEINSLEESNSSLKSELEETKKQKAKVSESEIEASYETLKEYENMVEELRAKVQDITNDLHTNAKETADLNEQLTKLNNAKEELNDAKITLETEVTNLKVERDDLEITLTSLRQTLNELEERNSSLDLELQILKAEKQKVYEIVNETVDNPDLQNYEKTIIAMNDRVKEITAELKKFAKENEELSNKVVELQETLTANAEEKTAKKSTSLTPEMHIDEMESARECITKEIMSLKPTAENHEFTDKSISELFVLFVRTIMSKEQEIIKAITDRSEREKRKLEEQNRQSCDAEKRATIWAKELEAEIERTQQDLSGQEAKTTELNNEISKLQNLLKESAHENQLLIEKMEVLELDFNTLQAELEKYPEAKQNVTLNSTQEKERLIQEAVQTREMELSAKLRQHEKQSKEKLEELTRNLEFYKTRNLELANNLEGLEANERQLKSIADIKTNELIKANNTVERLRGELEILTETHNNLTQQHVETSRQVDEITSVLKTKCDKLSEYKTKLETIIPEYEHLKDQAAERQLRLEKYKSEIECMTTENEKQISSLKDLLDSAEIKSAGYCKQLAELTNRNTILQTEIMELRTKYEELERANAKLTKSMRNSTSRIRAEEEMEDLRDQNRTLQRNLDGASNRISDLQEMKTQMLKELVDLRGKLDAITNENTELKNALSSHKATVNQTIELRGKYESLLQEKNRIALEYEAKKSSFLQLEIKHKECAKEIEELKKTNKELDEEMDDMVLKIEELSKEKAELDDKLYAIESSGYSNEETRQLKAQVEKLQSEIEGFMSQREQLRNELDNATKALESFRNENSELRVKVGHLDRGDSLSCDSSRSGSPALEAVRVDNRRRRSRTELFNQKRQLGIFDSSERPCCGECRCSVLQEEICKLERELVTKNGEIATMEIRIQSENFPHMKRCKDLEELHAASRRKCKHLEVELQKMRELKMTELSSECDKCKHWRANKRDQSTQCLPESEHVYLSGMGSGFVEDHIKMTKLQKTNDRLKEICRGRQRQITELQNKLKELEKEYNIKSSNDDEKSLTTEASSLSLKPDGAVNSRQAMKENVPTIWDNQRSAIRTRREWFN